MTDADRPRCLSSPRPKRHLFLFVSEAMGYTSGRHWG